MYSLIEKYIIKMSKEDVNNFALKKGIILSNEELDFTYQFIKKNYKELLSKSNIFKLERYKDHYTKENFSKITKVYQEYYSKYNRYL